MSRSLVATLAAFALVVPAAQAGDLQFGLSTAHQRWPGACSPVTVNTLPEPTAAQAFLGSGELGFAWIGPNVPSCTIWLDPDWPDWSTPKLCAIVVHEVGHLAGKRHSHGRYSVMNPVFGYIPHYCR